MYFWKTNLLAQEIKSGSITDKQWKNYYLASALISTISMYIINFSPRTGIPIIVEMIAITTILIFGINITYKTNSSNGSSASEYIPRMMALSLPITIKILLLSFLFGFMSGMVVVAAPNFKDFNEIAISIFTIIIQIGFFWRINVHLKEINI